MMKKWLPGVLVIGCLLCMAGCGKSSEEIIAELQRIDAEKKYGTVYRSESDSRDVTEINKGERVPSQSYETEQETGEEQNNKTLWEILKELETGQEKEPETENDGEKENYSTEDKTDNSNEALSDAEYVRFGTYEQDNNPDNGKEEIEWLVLEEENGEMLLISRYILDANNVEMYYDYDIWEKRMLRTWLNEEFYDVAFSEDEKSKIVKERVENPDNEGYDVSGGATDDYVFLLSVNEVKRYFGEDDSVYGNSKLAARATEYAIARGITVNEYGGVGEGNSAWDLRSNGYHEGYVAWVSDSGRVYPGGHAQSAYCGIRPVIRITLE